MFKTEEFDDSASACAIDALSIISKRSTSSTLSFQELDNEEVEHLFSIMKSGEASRSDLEEASSLNVLWCGVVLILKSNTYFIGNEDITTLAANLPVHVQRFFGALFSTFEVLMGHQRKNSVYLVQSLIVCVGPDKNNVQAVIVQMIKDYRSMFSYAYMFNRRTGATPVSQIEEVMDYFKNAAKNRAIQDKAPISAAVEELPMLMDDDDNDSYDQLMRAHTDNILAPSFSAPSVMPLRPVKLLSDDEHYGSDYQPAVASDLERDLTYNPYHPAKAEVDHNLALMADDSMYSMDGGSILNSYYKYNGWNNAVEEDEDSDNDNFQAPVTAPTAVKRMTRMRQSINRSTDGTEEPAKKSTKRRKSRTKGKRKGEHNGSGNEQSPTSGGAIATRWPQRDNEGGRDAGGGRPRDDSFDVEDLPHQDQSASRNARPGAPQASQTHSTISARGKLDSFSTQDDSEGEEGSSLEEDGDDESDFSNDPPVVTSRHASHYGSSQSNNNYHRMSARDVQARPRSDSGDVQDFSEEEDNPTAYHPSGTTRRPPVDIHSPSSVGSSIELSDKERHFPRNANKREEQDSWRKNTPAESSAYDWQSSDSKPRSETSRNDWATSKSGPSDKQRRMRSVLSDDDSEPEPAATAPAKPDVAPRYRNPLDASLEGGGLRAAYKVEEEQQLQPTRASRNPLDASIEAAPGRLRDSADQESKPWTSRTDSRDEQDRRSVIKVPSASPSKPAAAMASKTNHWSSRERESAPVELVSDWDTQLSDEETPVRVASSKLSVPTSQASASTTTTARVVQATTPAAAPANKSERHEDPAERAAAIEKLRQNVLKSKQAKEQATAAHASPAPAPAPAPAAPVVSSAYSQRPLPTQPGTVQASRGASAPPPASILRKSVTFEDQQQQAPMQMEGSPSNDVSREEAFIPFQHVDASAADMVLYGSRQNSMKYSSMEFKDDNVSVAQSYSSEDSLPKHVPPAQKNRNSVEIPPRETPAPAGLSLPPLHSGPNPSSSPSNAMPPSKPTFSRIPSDQLISHPSHHGSTPANVTAAAPVAIAAAPAPAHAPASVTVTTTVSSKSSEKPAEAAQPSASASISVQRSQSHLSLLSSAQKSKSLQNLPENYAPPPLSEFARSSGVILEGYLHKKAAGIMGMWQKRYFVFSESATSFAVLRIYSRAVVTAWGPVALGLRASIPMDAIEAVETVAAPSAKGKEFTIKFVQRSSGHGRPSATGSDDGSVYSDAGGSGDIKVTTLMADDPETRLLWVTTLSRALTFFLHQE